MLADFAAIVMKVIAGVWSWQTYHTVRAVLCSLSLSPLSRCSLSFGGFFFILYNHRQHSHTLSQLLLLIVCVGLFFWHRKICVIIIKVTGLSYVCLSSPPSFPTLPTSLHFPARGLSVVQLANLSFVNLHLLLLIPEIRSRNNEFSQSEKERKRYFIFICILRKSFKINIYPVGYRQRLLISFHPNDIAIDKAYIQLKQLATLL